MCATVQGHYVRVVDCILSVYVQPPKIKRTAVGIKHRCTKLEQQ